MASLIPMAARGIASLAPVAAEVGSNIGKTASYIAKNTTKEDITKGAEIVQNIAKYKAEARAAEAKIAEEARIKAETEARIKAETEARIKAETEARAAEAKAAGTIITKEKEPEDGVLKTEEPNTGATGAIIPKTIKQKVEKTADKKSAAVDTEAESGEEKEEKEEKEEEKKEEEKKEEEKKKGEKGILNYLERPFSPDQSDQIQFASDSTNKLLKDVLQKDGPKHCLVDGLSELIEKTAMDYVYMLNDAMIEMVRRDPNIRLVINSYIQDMIQEIMAEFTQEERNNIVDNLNGECRPIFSKM